MPKLKEVMVVLEKLAPLYLAEKWDNVGLMVGDSEAEVNKVLCALDVNEAVVEEAIQSNVDCIISHHPFIFKPMKQLDFSSSQGRTIKQLITHNIAVYSMHTNYDIAWGGLNDYLAEGLKLQDLKVLSTTYEESFCKVVVYVPVSHVDAVRKVIIEENDATIGQYKGCTFATAGEGSFMPLEGSNPYIGQTSELSLVEEKTISFMVPKSNVKKLIEAIKKVHPYEEMAYDVFQLENVKKTYGLGRYGKLKEAMPLGELLDQIKAYFGIEHLRVSTKDSAQMINTVAICSGAGEEFIGKASQVAQVYITGDCKFHPGQMAQSLGIVLVDVGHYVSESCGLVPIGKQIKGAFSQCEVIYSKVNGETLFIR